LGTGFANTQIFNTNNATTGYTAATSDSAPYAAAHYGGMDGNTLGQWFVGSRDEVLLARQSSAINNAGFIYDWYHTSSEIDSSRNWIIYPDGQQNPCCGKWDYRATRPFLAFRTTVADPAIAVSTTSMETSVGQPFAGYTISSTGGQIDHYTISPALTDTNLQFDPTTGLISGTPQTATVTQLYTINGFNDAGKSTVSLLLKVKSTAYSLAGIQAKITDAASKLDDVKQSVITALPILTTGSDAEKQAILSLPGVQAAKDATDAVINASKTAIDNAKAALATAQSLPAAIAAISKRSEETPMQSV
jgi:hypothetical protein